MIKAVIIDDEERSAENLSLLLNRLEADIEVAGVAHTALDGLAICDRVRPDIIFLDIQMPGSDGLELAPHLKKLCGHIVFVTAHQQYVVHALRLGAKDYLVKPVSENDLDDCLKRVLLNGDPAGQTLP
jgi:two-component system LytT family response regulator